MLRVCYFFSLINKGFGFRSVYLLVLLKVVYTLVCPLDIHNIYASNFRKSVAAFKGRGAFKAEFHRIVWIFSNVYNLIKLLTQHM